MVEGVQEIEQVRGTKDRQGSVMLTVKVPWKVGGSQAVKRYSVMDLGRDSPVLRLHCHQSFCSRSIRTLQTSRCRRVVSCLKTFISPSWS